MNVQFSFCFITGQQIIPSEMNFKFFNDFINEMRSLLKKDHYAGTCWVRWAGTEQREQEGAAEAEDRR